MVTRRLVDSLAGPAVAPLVGRASEIIRLTALRSGRAANDPRTITPEVVRGLAAANLADGHRAKTRRFLAGQLDPANNRATGRGGAGDPRTTRGRITMSTEAGET
jgi:hypothetical protein